MYKKQTRFMQIRNYRGSTSLYKGVDGFGSRYRRRKKRAAEQRRMQTETDLIAALGGGAKFVQTVYRRYRYEFAELNHDAKKCSAYLNTVAGIRMRGGTLWTDKAVESMFRRVLP